MYKRREINRKMERISNVSVLGVDLTQSKLTVWRKKHDSGRIIDVLTTFFVVKNTQIKDMHSNTLYLTSIKPKDRVTVDFVKEKDGRFIASNVVMVAKLHGRR